MLPADDRQATGGFLKGHPKKGTATFSGKWFHGKGGCPLFWMSPPKVIVLSDRGSATSAKPMRAEKRQ
jgi:hypothetical protein